MHPSPWLKRAAVVALVVCGTSASSAGAATTAAAGKCALGSVRGIAYVTGNPQNGIANLPPSFSTSSSLFGYRWNCSGGAVSVRKSPDSPGVDIRFAGNPGRFAIANVASTTASGASVTRNPDGSFHVSIAGDTTTGFFQTRTDLAFWIIVF